MVHFSHFMNEFKEINFKAGHNTVTKGNLLKEISSRESPVPIVQI